MKNKEESISDENNFQKTSPKTRDQINEDFDETPPQNTSLNGQVRELFITLDDGRTGYKKWEWVHDATLEEGGQWLPLGSFGDGSVYIPGVGSIFDLKETDNYLLKKNISSNEKLEIKHSIIESDEQLKLNSNLDIDEWLHNIEKNFEISFSENGTNNLINKYKEQDLNELVQKNYTIDKVKKIFTLNKNVRIDIFELYLPDFIYESLKNNNLNFISDLVNYDKENLKNINNLSEDDLKIIIESLIDFEKTFSLKRPQRLKDINQDIKKESSENIPIEYLNLPLRAYNPLRRNGIKFISDIFKFNENEIKQFKNFGQNSWIELENALENFKLENKVDMNFSSKSVPINFSKKNYGSSLEEYNNELSKIQTYNFWLVVMQNFRKLEDPVNLKYTNKILETFFKISFEYSSNFSLFENIINLIDNEWALIQNQSNYTLNDEYDFLKFKLFEKFISFNDPFDAKNWIIGFYKKIIADDCKSFNIFLQRYKGKSLAEVGRIKGLSRERVRQIEMKIIKLLGLNPTQIKESYKIFYEKKLFTNEKYFIKKCLEILGRIPCIEDDKNKLQKIYLDYQIKNEENLNEQCCEEFINKYLGFDLKERIEIYKRFSVNLTKLELDFHYEYITESTKPVGQGYWSDFEMLKQYLLRHAKKLGEPDLMPFQTSLDLRVKGIVQNFGGQSKVASLIGLKYQGQLVNPEGGRTYWTDEKLNILINDINKFYIQDKSIMPEKTQIIRFFKSTSIPEYKDKKAYSAISALTKMEQLTWEEVAKKFGRREIF